MTFYGFISIFSQVLIALGAYLIGSISSAILVSRFLGLPDPVTHGSHNPGATNVLRLGGKLPAILTLVGDSLKGFLVVWFAMILGSSDIFIGVVMLAVCLGHIFPVYFNFKGGKGVATALGVSFALSWLFGLALLGVWLVIAGVTRLSSLAAIVAFILGPILAYQWLGQNIAIMFAGLSILVITRHHSNINRLLRGQEPKIGSNLLE